MSDSENPVETEIKEVEPEKKIQLQRPKKPRTEAQKKAVEKMLEGRKKWAENKQKEKKQTKADKLKKQLKELETPAQDPEPPAPPEPEITAPPVQELSSEEEVEVIEKKVKVPKKKPKKKKKKVIVNNYYEESESSDEEQITNNYYKSKKKKQQVQFDIEDLPEDNIDLTQYYTQMEPDPRQNPYNNLRFV